MRDHGGNLDWAMQHYGGAADTWVDLSTGINRVPYPLPELPPRAWTDLPTRADLDALHGAARRAYDTKAQVLALAGAQAGIQAIPLGQTPGQARVLGPTYNEHAASLRQAGWQVREVTQACDLQGADLAVVVNPNNPTGAYLAPDQLRLLATQVGCLLVDESFTDPRPELSLCHMLHQLDNVLVLRSFGKFYGLAGLRLGFVLGPEAQIARLAEMAGPWPVSGAAIAIGCAALRDRDWHRITAARLTAEATRLDALAQTAGWRIAGGTELFRLYATADAARTQEDLARAQIWSRIFPWSDSLLRLGLPGSEAEWERLARAVGA